MRKKLNRKKHFQNRVITVSGTRRTQNNAHSIHMGSPLPARYKLPPPLRLRRLRAIFLAPKQTKYLHNNRICNCHCPPK